MQMILEKASKTDLIRNFSNLTLDKIVQNKYPAVGQLKREYGAEKVEKCVAIIVLDLSASFNGELSQEEAFEVAAEVSSSLLGNLSLEDVYFVCRQIKTSDNYGKLNVNKVLKTLKKHLNERSNKVATANYNDHLSRKVPADRSSADQEFKDEMRRAQLKHLKTIK